MSRNGSGSYSPPGASFPAVNGTVIDETKYNAVINDIASEITNSIAADGQTTITANLSLSNHKLTNVSNGTVSGDAVNYGQLVLYAPLASPALTGTPTVPTAAGGTNTTQIASTAFVTTAVSTLAPLASPTFTGDPKAPTPTAGDNDTSIATTAFVTGAISTESALTAKLAGTQTITGVKTFQSGAEPVAKNIVKAWCVFNGTTAGTNAPINGFNVSTVQRTGTGSYIVTMTNALPNTNFAVFGTTITDSVSVACVCESGTIATRTTTTFQIGVQNLSAVNIDKSVVCLCVLGV